MWVIQPGTFGCPYEKGVSYSLISVYTYVYCCMVAVCVICLCFVLFFHVYVSIPCYKQYEHTEHMLCVFIACNFLRCVDSS